MRYSLLRSLPAVLLATLIVPSIAAHGENDPADTAQPAVSHRCKSNGVFIAWASQQQAVISESGRVAACDVSTGEMSASSYEAPKEVSGAERQKEWQSLKETFAKSVSQKDPVTGTNIEWKNVAFLNSEAPSLEIVHSNSKLLRPEDGELAMYVARGRTASGHASGPAGTRAGLYALLYRHSDKYRLLPLELSDQDSKKWANWGYPIGALAGRYDSQSGRTLLYFLDKKLGPDPYRPGWAPFDAWWFDPRTTALTHIILPDGPWYADVAADPLFRPLGCFSCGCDCYRQYHLKVGGGSIFIRIAAKEGALHDSTTGIYVLKAGDTRWHKIVGTGPSSELSQISDDGCHIALNKSGGVDVLSICGSASS